MNYIIKLMIWGPAIITNQLKGLLGDMPGNPGDEFLGSEDLKILLVFPMPHLRTVDNWNSRNSPEIHNNMT